MVQGEKEIDVSTSFTRLLFSTYFSAMNLKYASSTGVCTTQRGGLSLQLVLFHCTDLGGDEGVRDYAAPHECPPNDVRAEIVVGASGKLLASKHPRASPRRRDSATPLLLRSPREATRGLLMVGRICFPVSFIFGFLYDATAAEGEKTGASVLGGGHTLLPFLCAYKEWVDVRRCHVRFYACVVAEDEAPKPRGAEKNCPL